MNIKLISINMSLTGLRDTDEYLLKFLDYQVN